MKKITLSKLYISVFVLLLSSASHAQIQKGGDINGEAINDNSGYTVSMPDVNTVAIGAPANDGNGNSAGHVRVYSWSGTAWAQKGNDIDGETTGDNSGAAISMPDANTVAIGGPFNSGNGIIAGHVRIYSWSGTSWVQKGNDIDGEALGDFSGKSVSMPDANTVAIGANQNSTNDNGHVRIYSWNGTAWVQKGADIDGEAADDRSGSAVSMPDANTVAISAVLNDGNGNNAGHVRVYTWSGTAWAKKGNDIDGEAAFDLSGDVVSMPDANTVAIGASLNDGNGNNSGHVRVYSWNGAAWVKKGNDIDGEAANDQSGVSVSMPNANTIAIGARNNNGNGATSGHVRIYSWNGTAWVKTVNDIDGEAATDESGSAVDMPDDKTVCIGAPYNNGNGTASGHVRVFRICNNAGPVTNVTACTNYTWPQNNVTYIASGIYTDTMLNAAGCDSIISLNLTINNMANISVTVSNPTLIAQTPGLVYQWVDCNNGYAPLPGKTAQLFTATKSGSYAVIVTQNGCTDTSSCYTITTTGIMEHNRAELLQVYPNPTEGPLTVALSREFKDVTITITTSLGQNVYRKKLDVINALQVNIEGPKGVYFITLSSKNELLARAKVLKQ